MNGGFYPNMNLLSLAALWHLPLGLNHFQLCEEEWKEALMNQYSLADAMTDK